MMLILADMSHSESDDYMFLVPIASSLAWWLGSSIVMIEITCLAAF